MANLKWKKENWLVASCMRAPTKRSDQKASHHDSQRDIFNVVKFGRLIDASGDAEAQRSTGPPPGTTTYEAEPALWPSAKRCVLPALAQGRSG